MMEFTIYPTEPPWSTNEDRNLHHMTRAKRIKAWKADTAAAWMTVPHGQKTLYIGQHRYAPPSIIQLEIGFPQIRTRDPHNYCGTVLKAITDGLVNIGFWPDDTPEWVGHRESLLIKGNLTKVILRSM